jgi:hypothetical protein
VTVTAYGGAELSRATARAVGVADAVESCVSLKRRPRGLSDTQFVSGIAEAIALGARRLDDLAVARGDVAQAVLLGSMSRRRKPRRRGCGGSRSATSVSSAGHCARCSATRISRL